MTVPLGDLGKQRGNIVVLRNSRRKFDPADYMNAEIAVAQRLSNALAWSSVSQCAKRVYEIDDDVFSIPPGIDAHADYQEPSIREGTKQCIREADLVTVTSEPLAEVMRGLNPNVAVLPMYIPVSVFELPPSTASRNLSLGWAGSNSHRADLISIAKPVREFLRRFPQWDARLVGSYEPSLFIKGRTKFTPFIDIVDWTHEYYQALDFDIGLAPLLDNSFNRCKNALKPLEYASRGIPTIASDIEPYRNWIEHGVTGFLVKSPREWLDALTELASDDELRLTMGARARSKARDETYMTGWRPWAQAYSQL